MSPQGYLISEEFRHRGTVYSPGEPLPPRLTKAELEALRDEGKITRVGEARGARRVELLLAGDDVAVLRRLRAQRAAPEVLEVTLKAALDQRRSPTLVEALRLALREPVIEEVLRVP